MAAQLRVMRAGVADLADRRSCDSRARRFATRRRVRKWRAAPDRRSRGASTLEVCDWPPVYASEPPILFMRPASRIDDGDVRNAQSTVDRVLIVLVLCASPCRDCSWTAALAWTEAQSPRLCPFSELRWASITPPTVQRLIDKIAGEYLSKANHVVRYLSAAYRWAGLRMGVKENPAWGVQQAKERRAHRTPEAAVIRGLISFMRERSSQKACTE